MRSTTVLHDALLQAAGTTQDVRITIGGKVYGMDAIVECRPSGAVMGTKTMSIGNCVAGEVELVLLERSANLPRMAELHIETRLVGEDRSAAEWVPAGVYFVDTRAESYSGVLTIHAYDAMLKAEATFLEILPLEQTWPITQQAAVAAIAEKMGLEVDSRTVINPSYLVEYPNDYTMREVLGYIAAANAGNWIITPGGDLRLVPLVPEEAGPNVGLKVSSLNVGTPLSPVSRVTLWYTDTDAFTAGNDSGYHLTADCPWATQSIADGVLAALAGYVYRPFEAEQAIRLDPAVELGDTVTIDNTAFPLCALSWEMCKGWTAELAAPGEEEVDHEYPYLSRSARRLKRTVTLGQSYFGASISREKGLFIQKTDGANVFGEAVFNSDTLAMRAVIDGKMVDCIFFDTVLRKYRLTGDVQIDGSLSSDVVVTDALYAEQGDVAQLTVDWIDTSKKVYKYLTGDTTDDNYFEGHDQKLSFVTGSVKRGDDGAPLTEQLYNRYGDAIYWEKDISHAQIVNGYPYIDGERVYTTTKATDYPVLVFQYAILTKRSLTFELDKSTGTYIPVDIYGSGSGSSDPERGRAKIIKTPDGWELVYTTTAGGAAGVYFRDDGFVDWKGRRADIQIDTAEKKFTVTPEGAMGSVYEITYEETAGGLRMTWPDGERFTVEVV